MVKISYEMLAIAGFLLELAVMWKSRAGAVASVDIVLYLRDEAQLSRDSPDGPVQ
jgi:hypothetical protein